MLKKLSLIFAASLLLAGNAFADQLSIYKVNVTNDSSSDVYLTKASAAGGCKVFWPNSQLPKNNGMTPFKLECEGNLPPALTLYFRTEATQSKGQTSWTSYNTSQFIDPSTNIFISDFQSQYYRGNTITPPPVLANNPAPPTN